MSLETATALSSREEETSVKGPHTKIPLMHAEVASSIIAGNLVVRS